MSAVRGAPNSPSDVAVIGGGLGGLSAAIHLRAAGMRVVLFEAGDRVGGRAGLLVRDGFRWDMGPSLLNYPWVFEDLFAAAGARLDQEVELRRVDPSVRFVWPDGVEIALSSRIDLLLRELSRLDPRCGPGLQRFLRDAAGKYRLAFEKLLPRNADGVLDWLRGCQIGDLRRITVWRSLDSELARFFPNRRIREALGSYAMYLGGSPLELPGFYSILPYGEIAYGLWLPRHGIYGLVEAIERVALRAGVEIRCGSRITRIRTSGGRVTGLELEDGRVEAFPLVVSNVDVPTTDSALLDEAGRACLTRRERRTVRMTPSVLTFYWGVRGRVAGLHHHTVFLPDDYGEAFLDLLQRGRVPGSLPFYVAVASETDPGLAPPGDSTVFVMVPTPLASRLHGGGTDDWVRSLRTRVLDRLASQGIRLDPSRIAVERTLTPADWRDRLGLHDGSAFGAAHSLSQIGPFRRRNRTERLRGLYYVGASTTPGTGLPMVTLGGRLVARRILDDVR